MSIRFYDEALCNKIKSWIRDPKVVVLSPEDTKHQLEVRADQDNDKPLELPLISLSREDPIEIKNVSKTLMSFDGVMINKNDTTRKIFKLNAIPIGLNYKLDIYTRYFAEGDEYLRNFIFQLINHPRMKVNIPYNGYDGQHVCSIKLDPNIDTDPGGIRLFPDQFSRIQIKFSISDAHLFSSPLLAEQTISGVDVDLMSMESPTEVEETTKII